MSWVHGAGGGNGGDGIAQPAPPGLPSPPVLPPLPPDVPPLQPPPFKPPMSPPWPPPPLPPPAPPLAPCTSTTCASTPITCDTDVLRARLASLRALPTPLVLPSGCELFLSGSPLVVPAGTHAILSSAAGESRAVLNGEGRSRLLDVHGTLELDGLHLTAGHASEGGGVRIHPGARTSIRGSVISNCSSTGWDAAGGALHGVRATIEVSGSTITGCSATVTGDDGPAVGGTPVYGTITGGAVYSKQGSVTLDGVNVSECSVSISSRGVIGVAYGGAVYSSQGNVTLVASTLVGCSATATGDDGVAGGGAVHIEQGSVTLDAVTVSQCAVSASGAAASSAAKNLQAFGGAMYSWRSNATLVGSKLVGCSATASGDDGVAGGGAVHSEQGSVILDGVEVSHCAAFATVGNKNLQAFGGAVYSWRSNATLVGSTLFGCSATASGDDGWAGGGAVSSTLGNVMLDGVNVSQCAVSATGGAKHLQAFGGAVYHEQGSVTLVGSTLVGCSVTATGDQGQANGGAVYCIIGFATLTNTTISRCAASALSLASGRGGGLYTESSYVLLTRQTLVTGCRASSGGASLSVAAGAFVTYALPAPPGRYVSATTCLVYREACLPGRDDADCPAREIRCARITDVNASVDGEPCTPILSSGQPCAWRRQPQLIGQMVEALPQSPVDEDYPYTCSAGLLGSPDALDQGTSRCAGPCPAGKLCSDAATVEPVDCPLASYCPEGSSAATRCLAGTVGNRAGLTEASECAPCYEGHWCSGGEAFACDEGSYLPPDTPQEDRTTPNVCRSCGPHGTTRGDGMASMSSCFCEAGFYDAADGRGSLQCTGCPIGANCSASAISLSTLPLQRGYFRPSAASLDLRRCPDASVSAQLSGCIGGPDPSGYCVSGLSGPFCRLCAEPRGHYYEAATHGRPSSCRSCGEQLALTTLRNGTGLLFLAALAIGVLTMAYRRLAPASQRRMGHALAMAATPLKILVGFYLVATKVPSVYHASLPAPVVSVLRAFEVSISFGLSGVSTLLSCAGAPGYGARLGFWALLPLVLTLVVLAATRMARRSLVQSALPVALRLLFLLYPTVTQVAFEAFSCYDLGLEDEPRAERWLIVDVSVECGSNTHRSLLLGAWLAIGAYSVGMLVTYAALLLRARHAIVTSQPTALSKALRFLHHEYSVEYCFWELAEMARRLVLVGFLVPFAPGSLQQLACGLMVAVVYLLLQLQARPYRRLADNYLAMTASFSLVVLLFGALLLRMGDVIEQALLPPNVRDLFALQPVVITAALLSSVVGSLLVAALVLAQQLAEERTRLVQEARAARTRRLRHRAGGSEVVMPPIGDGDFHLFLSHAWGTGQDQMRVVKQRLTEMLPDVAVFLDVDDLQRRKGKGAELVARSEHFLVFCSGGFFSSPNCIRELVCAVLRGKPIIALMEPDRKHGRLTTVAAKQGLVEAVARYDEWGLVDEVRGWGFATPPGVDEVYDAMFAAEPIVWDRIGVFQDVSLRLLAERLLSFSLRGATYLQDELTCHEMRVPPPRGGRRFHLFCCADNAGARELTVELGTSLGQTLEVTSDVGEMAACERALLYLNGKTWASGDASSGTLARAVEAAMEAGVGLLLAHECLGEGSQEERLGVEFEDVLGATPQALLARGVYHQIAIALKGGAWREVSMHMLAQELVATEIGGVSAAQPAPPSGRVLPVRWRRLQDVLRRRVAPRHTSTVGPLPAASPPLVQPLLRGGNGFAPIVLNSPCRDLDSDHTSLPAAAGGELELAPRD